jgi:hypothetical protein
MDEIKKVALSHPAVQTLITPVLGQECCRKKVGEFFNLSLGFGKKIPVPLPISKKRLNTEYYGEWEIGTYQKSWRIIKGQRIIHGGCEPFESEGDMDSEISRIAFGKVKAVYQLSQWDVRIELDSDWCIDFLSVDPNEDTFHVFCPNNRIVLFKASVGWFVGPSDKPWSLE